LFFKLVYVTSISAIHLNEIRLHKHTWLSKIFASAMMTTMRLPNAVVSNQPACTTDFMLTGAWIMKKKRSVSRKLLCTRQKKKDSWDVNVFRSQVMLYRGNSSDVPRGGVGVFKPHPEIPKALQNRTKLNPVVKTNKNCWT